MDVSAYAALSATTPVVPFIAQRREPRTDDVVIDISHCGVCHSDLHQARNDWGNSKFPMVPGHEIVGRVASVGSAVTGFKPGDSVAVGCMVDSCQDCGQCHDGLEQYCAKGHTLTYNDVDKKDGKPCFGGYSKRIVVNEKFVLRVPAALDAAGAAPLLCAGITVWSPLKHWGAGPGKRVAVVGLGGLGHMALKFARALGADEVVLFTRSPGKEADALALGAHRVVVSTDAAAMKAETRKFDLIIDTVPYAHPLDPYLATLALDGTLVIVGLIGAIEPAPHSFHLIGGRRRITGSAIGGIAETQEMLDFCGAHGIVSDIEMIAMPDINAAYERMLKSDVKYRFVIDLATLPG